MAEPPQPRRRAPTIRVAVVLLLAAAGAQAQQAPPVAVTTASRDAIVREVTLTGTLSSPRRSALAPEVSDRVTDVLAEAGDRVDSGDALLRLDDGLSRIEVRVAEAALQEARANLADARRRLREAEDLAARDTIGKSELESRRARLRQAEAIVARRAAERDLQSELVDRHTLTAPFDGVINRRMIDVGERATPDNPVFELVAIQRLRLDLEVPQQYFGDVVAGTDALVRFDARPDMQLDNRVDTVIPVSSAASRTFNARINLDNSDGRLTPGMSARATLRIETGRSGVVIPQDALIRHPDGRTVVWLAEGDGETRSVREQRVGIGLKFGGRIAVREGLEAGAAIVTEGNEALQDGQQVRVVRTE